MGRRSNWLMVVLGAIAFCATPAVADQRECEADQLKELGRYSKKLYQCLSKAVKKNTGAGECLADASNQLTEKLAKIDEKSGCQIETDFPALDTGLQSSLARSTNEIQQSLKQSSASIEPCEVDYADIWQVTLLDEDELRVRVDTINDRFYFDPGLSIAGVTNDECVAGSRPLEQLMEFDTQCSFDPAMAQNLICEAGPNAGEPCGDVGVPSVFCETSAGAADGVCIDANPDGFCPELAITSGAIQQVCQLTVFVEGSCEDVAEDVDDETRGDYELEIFINSLPGVATRVQSNVDLTPEVVVP